MSRSPANAAPAPPVPPPGTTVPPPGYSDFVYQASRSMMALWARLWLRLSTEGREHVPMQGPLLAVANHCSFLDPPLLGVTVVRPVRFLAKQGLAAVPPLRWWLRKVGVSLIDRNAPSKDVLRKLTEQLQQGGCVAVFAEGTRSDDGKTAPFRTGVEFLVRRTGAPVLPVGIEGSFRALPKGAWFTRPRKCTVRCSEVWSPERVLAPGGSEALRREVARLAHAALSDDPPASAGEAAGVGHGPGALPADSSPSAGSRS
ncbi:MAG: lysophospholipid acyltransferase family protein [Planctomycetota bacterium]